MKVLLGELIVNKYDEDGVIDENLGSVVERKFNSDDEVNAYIQGLDDAVGNQDFKILTLPEKSEINETADGKAEESA